MTNLYLILLLILTIFNDTTHACTPTPITLATDLSIGTTICGNNSTPMKVVYQFQLCDGCDEISSSQIYYDTTYWRSSGCFINFAYDKYINTGSTHCYYTNTWDSSCYFNSPSAYLSSIVIMTEKWPNGHWKTGKVYCLSATCDMKITNFSSSSNTIEPGEIVTFSGSISVTPASVVSWAITWPGGKTARGTGMVPSAVWDGRDNNGMAVPDGVYTVTLSAQTSNGWCNDSQNISVTVKSCNLKITSFSGTSKLIPSSGGDINLFGSITDDSGKPISWTINSAGKTYAGTGTSPTTTWDGKDVSGKTVDPGGYSATLTVQTADGLCSDIKTIPFTVEPPPDNSCALYVNFGSSANITSGALTHSQDLFSSRGNKLATSFIIYYDSQNPRSASLGAGWSHSYDIFIKQNKDSSVMLHEGNGKRKLYILNHYCPVKFGCTSVNA